MAEVDTNINYILENRLGYFLSQQQCHLWIGSQNTVITIQNGKKGKVSKVVLNIN